VTVNELQVNVNKQPTIGSTVRSEYDRFADIYLRTTKMARSAHWNRFRFFLWIGLVYLTIWVIVDLVNYPGTFVPRLYNNIWRYFYILILNFLFFEFVVPWVRKKRRYLVYNILLGLLSLWVMMMFCSYGLYWWRMLGVAIGAYTPLREFKSVSEGVSYGAGYGIMSIFYFGGFSHMYNYIGLQRAAQQLRIEKQEAELNYLKSQTNPHFLFNTLNNIYSLAKDKSDLAPESIMRLSKILRYMLYETSGDFVSIEQELKIMNDYLALEKLRYDESLRVNFNYQVEDMRQSVPPLLLIPLVENAFKHGVSETRHMPFVDIHLTMNSQRLEFIVKNSTEDFSDEKSVKENIGLSNLRRQLQLLYTDYDLKVEQAKGIFVASLKIRLNSHV